MYPYLGILAREIDLVFLNVLYINGNKFSDIVVRTSAWCTWFWRQPLLTNRMCQTHAAINIQNVNNSQVVDRPWAHLMNNDRSLMTLFSQNVYILPLSHRKCNSSFFKTD
jgi:hypothetical protein